MGNKIVVNMSLKVDRKVLNEEIQKKIRGIDKSKDEFVEIFNKVYEMGIHDGVDAVIKALGQCTDD